MRDFISSNRAAELSLPGKVLYTAFAALTVCGLVSCAVLYDGIVDFGAHATPAELYGRLLAHYGRDASAIGYQKLVEVTHAHLFSTAVLLLVAGHLFLLTGATVRTKLWLIGIGVASVMLHLAAPWLLYALGGRAGSGLLYPVSGTAMLLSLGVMTCAPIWAMWRPR